LTFKSALVHAEPEVTVETPTGSPRVSDDPVVLSPTDNLDSMTTELFTSDVSVDTRVVRHEISIDGETGLNWTVGVNFLFNHINSVVAGISMSSVFSPLSATWARGEATGDLTRARSVWVARVRDDTSASKVRPSFGKVTTLTSKVGFVTRDHILWGEDDVVTTFDASSIRKNLRGGESPAGTASGLISDGMHASGPLISRIKGAWDGDVIFQDFS